MSDPFPSRADAIAISITAMIAHVYISSELATHHEGQPAIGFASLLVAGCLVIWAKALWRLLLMACAGLARLRRLAGWH